MPCPFASRARATEDENLTEVIITDDAVGQKRCARRRRRRRRTRDVSGYDRARVDACECVV